MKIILFFVVTVMFLVPVFHDAYGQSETMEENPIYILLQVEIRNEVGQLAGYFETDGVVITDFDTLSKTLDESGDAMKRHTYTNNDNEFEVFTGTGEQRHDSYTVMSQSIIDGPSGFVVIASHSGFSVAPGDVVTLTWTFVRNVV
jgi:hypothetical protein